jgi:hypothetical protein
MENRACHMNIYYVGQSIKRFLISEGKENMLQREAGWLTPG